MTTQSKLLEWAGQMNSKALFFGTHICRSACRKLAADKTPQAVPFLVSALASPDEQTRCIAEQGLKSIEAPEAIDAALLGYVFTRDQLLGQILTSLGRNVSETDSLPPHEADETASAFSTAKEAWRHRGSNDGTVLAFVPEGDFMAGKEGFQVHLPAYYLALTCVTNAQYARFLTECGANTDKAAAWINIQQSDAIRSQADTYRADSEKAEMPVVWVTWEGAAAYCKWAGLRLPTELEWEKGARGVDGRIYPWGDEWEQGRTISLRKQQRPEQISNVWANPAATSPYGLYQMIGNVYEWCADWYEQGAYERYARGDLSTPPHAEHKTLRGGPWRFGTPTHLRTEYRKGTAWRAGTPLCGFRCAKSL
jgi:formylglycine-generating enzyme required for sulfatase activity